MNTRRINPEDIALRRAQRHRWASLRAREDQRSYREHLAMLEPDEPIWHTIRAQEWAQQATGD